MGYCVKNLKRSVELRLWVVSLLRVSHGCELFECVLRFFGYFLYHGFGWMVGFRVLSFVQNVAWLSDGMRLRRRLLSCVGFLGSAVEFV